MNDIGKIVEGIGHASKERVQILVTSDEGNRVSGFIMGSTGRPTNKREKILSRGFTDHSTGIDHPGGWMVLMDSLPPKPPSLTSTLRDMDAGDTINLAKDAANINVVRNIAGRLNVDMDRNYTVNRTPEGCTITRKA